MKAMLCLSLLFVASATIAYAANQNQIRVEGTVVDQNGEAVVGASVLLNGATSTGTATDADGKFSLLAPANGSLSVICIGFTTQEVAINGKSVLEVVLKEDSTLLDATVVVGYSVQKKSNLTGAVSTISGDILESRPVSDVSHALQGVSPGLNISTTANGGELGQSMNINIRGAGSIGSGSSAAPLILIDGIEGDLNAVNPNDIESISVLKDAAASSIYGARAAFGVILVTTKSGKAGKIHVSYTGNVRFTSATQKPEMVDSYSFAKYWNMAAANAGGATQFGEEAMQRIQKFQQGIIDKSLLMNSSGISDLNGDNKLDSYGSAYANNNWFDFFYRDGVPSQEHNLSITGGSEKINFALSGNFLGDQGILAVGTDKLKRYTLNAKIGAQMAKWARVDYNVKYTRSDYSRPSYLKENGGGLFYHNIARRWPTVPAYDENGNAVPGMEIEELLHGGQALDRKEYMTHQLAFDFEPITDWHINVNGSYQKYSYESHQTYLPIVSYNADGTIAGYAANGNYGPGQSAVVDNTAKQDYFTLNAVTHYSKTIQKHYFKVMAGFNAELKKYSTLYGEGTTLNSTTTPYLSQTTENQKVRGTAQEYAIAGFFGRINYNYDERYLIEANLRYDGSSRFVGNKRWGLFPSFSAGWNIAKEPFMENAKKTVNLLKIRASWGSLGNSNTNSWYPFYSTMGVGSSNSAWLIDGKQQNTASMAPIVSSEMTWETVQTLDFGLDFAFFNNRLTGIFDWYNRNTLGMVGPAPTLPSILGAEAPKINNCDLRTNGWELEISWRDHVSDFQYGARVVLSDYTSVVTKYPNETKALSQTYYPGMTIGEIWGYETQGIAQSQTEMDAWLVKNKPTWGSNWGPGDIMYKDQNGDGIVNTGNNTATDSGDRKVIGNNTPRYSYGISLDAAWKGIDFAIFFQGVGKRDWAFSAGDIYFWSTDGRLWQSCCFKEHLNCWTPENPNGYYPKPYLQGNIKKNQEVQTRYLQDASYCRIKNIQLGYTFPEKWMSPAHISKLRVYFSADNLCTFTKMAGQFDPEVLNGLYASGKTYPLTRTFSFGLNLNF